MGSRGKTHPSEKAAAARPVLSPAAYAANAAITGGISPVSRPPRVSDTRLQRVGFADALQKAAAAMPRLLFYVDAIWGGVIFRSMLS